ncbi:Transcriptional regulator, ArsR family [Caenispirillum salinarum AK4]|uniref:Transcriptional regulator, ArsR family n=1 Tax=Caenispirillum salinarum AK4 TaxID=1238182 RepID=K9HCG1_9PROT|nr:metalloregulator ArsR/SmtB family transcription factor [Caenispirillum salinarum]EKV28218.1 Transcriptional regulator, ArsR family [Caenispirillum salinarum AK4]
MVQPLETVLSGLRGAGEETRLRLLALCSRGELTVSDMTRILGQSQPRISRHLKVMVDAGLLERFREGAWVFYRLAYDGTGAAVARAISRLLDDQDPVLALDITRLESLRAERDAEAAEYFSRNAAEWDRIRSLHVDDAEVERQLLTLLPPDSAGELLDIGTGTGRVLTLYGPHVERAVGVDRSREMLSVARTSLDREGLANCMVRLGDMYQLPVADGSFDSVVIHQVLHYAERPADALAEAARVLRPGGRLVVVDFAPHDLEELRQAHNHRRLGFSDKDVFDWCAAVGLTAGAVAHLPGTPLTVTLWQASRPAATDTAGPRKVPAVSEESRP